MLKANNYNNATYLIYLIGGQRKHKNTGVKNTGQSHQSAGREHSAPCSAAGRTASGERATGTEYIPAESAGLLEDRVLRLDSMSDILAVGVCGLLVSTSIRSTNYSQSAPPPDVIPRFLTRDPPTCFRSILCVTVDLSRVAQSSGP